MSFSLQLEYVHIWHLFLYSVSDKLMYFTMPAFSNDIGSEISLVVEIPGLDPATLTGFFQYKDDPQVTGVNPSDGIVSGGTVSVVSGYNLDSVQNPLLIIRPSPTSPPYISVGVESLR